MERTGTSVNDLGQHNTIEGMNTAANEYKVHRSSGSEFFALI